MLLKRLFATTTGAIAAKGATILTALFLFRQLPAADMGRYTAALTLVSFCAILANAGLNPLTTREVARLGAAGSAWWGAIAPLRLLLALAAYVLLAAFALLIPALVDTRLALIAGLLLLPDTLAGMLSATLTGLGRAALASWLDALRNVGGLAATLALVLLWHGGVFSLAWLAIALAGWALLINGLALARSWRPPPGALPARTPAERRADWTPARQVRSPAAFRLSRRCLASRAPGRLDIGATGAISRRLPPVAPVSRRQSVGPTGRRRDGLGHAARWGAGVRETRAGGWTERWARSQRHVGHLLATWRQALGAALPLGLGALAATLYFRVDTLFLSAARGSQAVAYYSAPYQIVESFWLISTSWNAVALPILARRYSPRLVEHSMALLLSIGLPASLLIAFRAEDVATLVFGPAYLPAALPLRLVIWVVPILFSYVPVVTALFVHDRQGQIVLVLLGNLALALLLDGLLIPLYGLAGASAATVIVEAGALAGYLWLAHRSRLGIRWASGLLRPAQLCAPLLALLALGRGLPFLLMLPLAVLLWAVLFWLLRPWAVPPVVAEALRPPLPSSGIAPFPIRSLASASNAAASAANRWDSEDAGATSGAGPASSLRLPPSEEVASP